jgi:AIG2-like family
MLASARLVFRNVADLEFAPGEKTPCGLWMIQRADERALDRYEGVAGGGYFKTEEIELEYAGKRRKSLVYLMNCTGIYPPSQHYADIIRRGYRDFGLDESYLDAAIERSFVEKNPDDYIIDRRTRQRSSNAHRKLVDKPLALLPQLIAPQPPPETSQ